MTPAQRVAALRLADALDADCMVVGYDDVASMLRHLAAEPVQEPVAWRSKTRINDEFDSGWHLTSTEPPQTPRTIAIEPLYAAPQQRRPLTHQQLLTWWNATAGQATSMQDRIIQYGQMIEAAHGITGKPT